MRLPKNFLQVMKDTILKDNKLSSSVVKDCKPATQTFDSVKREEDGAAPNKDNANIVDAGDEERRTEDVKEEEDVTQGDKEAADDVDDVDDHREREAKVVCYEVATRNEGSMDDKEKEALVDIEMVKHRINVSEEDDVQKTREIMRLEETNENPGMKACAAGVENEIGLLVEGHHECFNDSYKTGDKVKSAENLKELPQGNKEQLLLKQVSAEPEFAVSSSLSNKNSKTSRESRRSCEDDVLIEMRVEKKPPHDSKEQSFNENRQTYGDSFDVKTERDKCRLDIVNDKTGFTSSVHHFLDGNLVEANLGVANSRILARDSIDGTLASSRGSCLTKAKSDSGIGKPVDSNTKKERLEEEDWVQVPESPVGSPRKSSNEKALHRIDSNDSRVSEGSNSKESQSKRRTRSASDQHTSKTLSVLKSFFDALDRRKLHRQLSENNDSKLNCKAAENDADGKENNVVGKSLVAQTRETRSFEGATEEKLGPTVSDSFANTGGDGIRTTEMNARERKDSGFNMEATAPHMSTQAIPLTATMEIAKDSGSSIDMERDRAHSEREQGEFDNEWQGERVTAAFTREENASDVSRENAIDPRNADPNRLNVNNEKSGCLNQKPFDDRGAERQSEDGGSARKGTEIIPVPDANEKPFSDNVFDDDNDLNYDDDEKFGEKLPNFENVDSINPIPQSGTLKASEAPFNRHTCDIENVRVNVKTTSNLVPSVSATFPTDEGASSLYSSNVNLLLSQKNTVSDIVFKITCKRTLDEEKGVRDIGEQMKVAGVSGDKPAPVVLEKSRLDCLTEMAGFVLESEGRSKERMEGLKQDEIDRKETRDRMFGSPPVKGSCPQDSAKRTALGEEERRGDVEGVVGARPIEKISVKKEVVSSLLSKLMNSVDSVTADREGSNHGIASLGQAGERSSIGLVGDEHYDVKVIGRYAGDDDMDLLKERDAARNGDVDSAEDARLVGEIKQRPGVVEESLSRSAKGTADSDSGNLHSVQSETGRDGSGMLTARVPERAKHGETVGGGDDVIDDNTSKESDGIRNQEVDLDSEMNKTEETEEGESGSKQVKSVKIENLPRPPRGRAKGRPVSGR